MPRQECSSSEKRRAPSESGSGCTITSPAKADEFHIAAGATVDITWKLKGAQGYQFTEPDGIKFSPPAPAGIFTRKTGTSRQEFTFTDQNDGPGKP